MYESFTGGSLPATFEETSSSPNYTANGVQFPGGGDGERRYIRTVFSDFAASDFIAEVTVTIVGGGGYANGFFGLGTGERNAVLEQGWGEPVAGVHAFLRVTPTAWPQGLQVFTSGSENSPKVEPWVGDGTHRLRMIYDADAQTIAFEVHANYAGGPFVATHSVAPISVADVGYDATNAHIFFGGAGNVTYRDFVVVPEPASLALIGVGATLMLRRRRN